MPSRSHSLIQSLDEKRCALLAEAEALDPGVLMAKPMPEKWAILEILEHLILAERVILQGLPPLEELAARPRSLRNRCLYSLVMFILKARIPVKVPSRRMAPTGQFSLPELRLQWDENLRWLEAFVASRDPLGLRGAVFTHPVAGPITLAQALRMDHLHQDAHLRQIRKLAGGGA